MKFSLERFRCLYLTRGTGVAEQPECIYGKIKAGLTWESKGDRIAVDGKLLLYGKVVICGLMEKESN